MLGFIGSFTATFMRRPECYTQIKRNTMILRRIRPPRLNKMGGDHKKFRRSHYYYELVEDTDLTKKPPIELVLTSDVPGLGMKGEKVEMDMYMAYRDLLLPKLAVYASSPEAKDILTSTSERQYSSVYSKIVENYLAEHGVEIVLTNDAPWTLEPWHVKVALRKIGVLAEENCVEIPRKISGPKPEIENKDFIVNLTMNKQDTFPIRCRIRFWSTSDPSVNQKPFDLSSPVEALFPEEKDMIKSLIETELNIKKNKEIREKLTYEEPEIRVKPQKKKKKKKKKEA